MNYKFMTALVLCVGLCFQAYGNNQELFLRGNEAYKQQDYQEALACYEQITSPTAETLYNMGLSALKLNKLGQALAYLRRAEHEWGFFNKTDLMSALAMVRERIAQKKHSTQKKQREWFYSKGYRSLTKRLHDVPLIVLQLFVLIMWVGLFLRVRSLYKAKKRGLIIVIFSLLVMSSGLLAIKYGLENRRYVVVTAEQVILRTGPSDEYKEIVTCHEGQEGYILEHRGSFYKVRFDEQLGWVPHESVQRL